MVSAQSLFEDLKGSPVGGIGSRHVCCIVVQRADGVEVTRYVGVVGADRVDAQLQATLRVTTQARGGG